MRIIQNISGRCGVREEGCRAIAKQKWHLEWIDCILTVTQVMTTKSEWPAPTSLGELPELSIVTGSTRSNSDVHALMMLLLMLPQ